MSLFINCNAVPTQKCVMEEKKKSYEQHELLWMNSFNCACLLKVCCLTSVEVL